jgi:hypothetical protein
MKRWCWLPCVIALLSCSSGGGTSDVTSDAPIDVPDAAEVADDADDAGPDGSDATSTEADVPPTPGDLLCADSQPEPATWADGTKFSLAVYHFNLQYVAGGIHDFLAQPDTPEEALEDLIVTESFAPLVELFERHPTWGGSFEMQGLFLEVLEQRFPDLLVRFGHLVQRGQVDLMSFHWSDQLFLAYPYRDQKWSWDQNQRLLQRFCLPQAPAFFTQEGQYGEGMARLAHDEIDAMGILPRNQLSFNLGADKPRGLWLDRDGLPLVTTDGFTDPATGWVLDWNFVDDAELLATGGINPYFPELFKVNDKAVQEYEARLQALEDDGFRVTTIREYRRQLEAAGIARTPVPFVHDGQWQSDAGDNLFQWMGFGAGWAGDERDNAILTGNVKLSRRLRAAEILLDQADAAGKATAALRARLDGAIRDLLKAEVSDSTGWRPYIVEIRYSLDHAAAAEAAVQGVLVEALELLGLPGDAWVDLRSEEVSTEVPASAPPPLLDAPPFPFELDDGGRGATVTTEDWGSHVDVWIDLPSRTPATSGSDRPAPLRVSVPEPLTHLVTSPALLEDRVVSVPLADYELLVKQDVTPKNRLCVGTPNGLVGLGGDRWLIVDTATLHVATCLSAEGVWWEDQTQPNQDATLWHLVYLEGTKEQALELAWRVNVEPVVAITR